MPKLLLIDDDKEVLKINAKYFIQDGYTVKAATNARTAYKLLKDYTPDCIVLDVMMPGIDGFKACTELKKLCQAPVIFLTGRDSEDDKVQGLLLGADDYMIKPYSLRELSARIQVLIRRYQKTSVVSAAVSEDFLDEDAAQVNRKLIDQSANSKCIIGCNRFLRIEYLAHV